MQLEATYQEMIAELLKGLDDNQKAEILEQLRNEINFRLECLYGHNGG